MLVISHVDSCGYGITVVILINYETNRFNKRQKRPEG
jgi:hypothetical protein